MTVSTLQVDLKEEGEGIEVVVEEEDDGEERKGERGKEEKILMVVFCKTMFEMIQEAYNHGWKNY